MQASHLGSRGLQIGDSIPSSIHSESIEERIACTQINVVKMTAKSNFETLCYRIRRSWLFKVIAKFLTQKELVRLQLLDRFFYDV